MNSKKMLVVSLAVGLIIAGLLPQAEARKWTITQREAKLSREIDQGQKANELTLKEATGLRDKISDIDERITKMKEKNGGKLSYADENAMEKELNKLSLSIQKKKLEKRVEHP